METPSRKRPRSPSPGSTASIFRSEAIEDRASTFIALYSPTLSAKSLQANADFKSASHRIAAWRKPGKQRSLSQQLLYESGHDDDGEKYAGKKLESLLQAMNAEGAVVVARWYGGVLLGPVRFTHIESCAREAILKWRDEHARKRQNVEDKEVTARLIKSLLERDESIDVLRNLLAEKQKKTILDVTSPPRKMDYSALPLRVLQQLDKTRDTTISWILKEIDKAEEMDSRTTEADAKGQGSGQS